MLYCDRCGCNERVNRLSLEIKDPGYIREESGNPNWEFNPIEMDLCLTCFLGKKVKEKVPSLRRSLELFLKAFPIAWAKPGELKEPEKEPEKEKGNHADS